MAQGPIRKQKSSREEYSDFLSRRPLHLTFGLSSISPLARFWIAVVIVVAASVAAFIQSPRPDALRPPRWLISTSWWRYPFEWNAANRLPKIECSLKAIHAVPNSTSIWAVGNKGMVVSSTDGGKSWTKKGIEERQLVPDAAPSPSPALSPPTLSSTPATQTLSEFFGWLDIVPVAVAAQDPNAPAQAPSQAKPTPTTGNSNVPRSNSNRTQRSTATPTPRPAWTPAPRPLGTPRPRSVSTPASGPTSSPLQPTASPSPSPGLSAAPNAIAPESEQLIAVHFVDENSGEAISNMAMRYATNNGGETWVRDDKYLNLEYAAGIVLTSESNAELLRLTVERPFVTEARRLSNAFLPLTASDSLWVATQDPGYLLRFGHAVAGRVFIPPKGQLLNSVSSAYFLADQTNGWAVTKDGFVYRTVDKGLSWQGLPIPQIVGLLGIFFADGNRGWVVGSNGTILSTSDDGKTWRVQESGTTSQLNAVNFMSDGRHGWIAGSDGVILSTADGGATWVHRTQGQAANAGWYLRFPAPWYFVTLLLVGLLVWRKPKVADAPAEESVADVLVSDRPLEEATGDVLAFNAIARGLSRFLRNENTLPPLTIAITGEWGTGKSSLMNLLRADLRSYKFRPVWFNAWHHQKEEHMLASLLENIKLQAVPRWWTSRGLFFRARLLGIRGVRQWLPVVLLLFFIYVLGIYYYHAGGALDDRLSRVLSAPDFKTLFLKFTPSNVIEVLPILAGVITFVGAVWRGITAFGVKPASLLAGVSRGVSIRGLEAQTSFRQKFAAEFNDVTRALGKRSLLIFIDDLDRCRPENVLETLEAVNFLTTSGECFVVIGMAREYVERCVGRAFNEVAQEMVDEREEGTEESAEDIAKQKRIDFARQYLDKLVNIEVPVPAPKQAQSLALLVASTREAEFSKPNNRWQQLRLSLVSFVERRWQLLLAVVVAAGLLFIGYYMARRLAGTPNEISAAAVVVPTPQPTVAPSPVASPVATPTPLASPTPTPAPTPTPTPDTERAVVAAGARAFFSSAFLPALALFALIWLGSTILTRRPGLVVKDSPRFIQALEIWHPLVFARQGTPRATKRFMNFVRYLAMRQRRQSDSQPPIKQFLANLKERLAGVRTPAEVVSDLVNADSDVQQIPDEVLVALAALQHLNPECLTEHPGPAGSPDNVWPRAISATNPLRPLFEKAREDHQAEFGNWGTLSQYRNRFLEMTANVQVR